MRSPLRLQGRGLGRGVEGQVEDLLLQVRFRLGPGGPRAVDGGVGKEGQNEDLELVPCQAVQHRFRRFHG